MKSVVAACLMAGAFALDSSHVDPLPGWDFICNGYLANILIPGRQGLGTASPWLGEVGCMRACENQGHCDFVTYDNLNGNCWMEIIPDRPNECDSNTGGWAYWRKPQDDVVALNAEAVDSCPFTAKHLNSEGLCATCHKSSFAGDERCVCGPGGADWITSEQVVACPSLNAEADDSCPFTAKHLNSEGLCATCHKSSFAGDEKCVCGPGGADWITSEQVVACPALNAEDVDSCPFTAKHLNSEGLCQVCHKSPFHNDDRCVCGPGSSDWITNEQVVACGNVNEDDCPFTAKHLNSEGFCQVCHLSPFANDKRCVCGPASSDWIYNDQVVACPALNAEDVDSCPFTAKHLNSEGLCAACHKSSFANDERCVCGPGGADWITNEQVVACPALNAEDVDSCPFTAQHVNSEGLCAACHKSPFANDERCVCGPAEADWITSNQIVCTTECVCGPRLNAEAGLMLV